MTCPKIFLVRHGESVGNVDKSVHFTTPDHAIGLSDKGKLQAEKAGEALVKYFQANEIAGYTRMWVSPYLRTRETAAGIAKSFPFGIDQREHINIVEQQFGLFDGHPDEELAKLFPLEHAHYDKCEKKEGKFWARMPLGESRFDVAIRVHQFFGTLMRDYEKHNISNVVIVSHGVTNRAFTMQWLHLPFEWFEREPNPNNCSIRLIDGNTDCGYIHAGE